MQQTCPHYRNIAALWLPARAHSRARTLTQRSRGLACVQDRLQRRQCQLALGTAAFGGIPEGQPQSPLQRLNSRLKVAWPWAKQEPLPAPPFQLSNACAVALSPDHTGTIPWTYAVQEFLAQYWREERGVLNEMHLHQHLSHAVTDPMQRDLRFVSGQMAQWDDLRHKMPRVDPNRIVRADARVMSQSPVLWAQRVQKLASMHPDIDWLEMLTVIPNAAFMPWATFVGVVNAFALGLAMGLRGPVRSPTSCQS
mmetsp:Transcript_7086/g.20727  ORF Transcript_7086/g.20727 Transcript_7086/m.20727 type:complete len:253 (+) Transcript_7086:376-1134(+)